MNVAKIKLVSRLREGFRKIMVSLKRKPQTIPMLVLAAAFVYYSLNLTHISNTTAKIQLPGMGLTGFCTMLFSMLSFVCFINAYPRRKKTNMAMLILMFLMLFGLIFCDTYYAARITQAITRADHPIVIDANTLYIEKAHRVLMVHRLIVACGAVLTMLVPVLRRMLKKVNTSLAVEENADMGAITLSE